MSNTEFYKQLKDIIFKHELKRIINSFEGHKGRPGKVGGSLPKGANPNFKQEIEEVIAQAKSNDNSNKIALIGEVNKRLTEEAKQNGFDIADYKHNIDVYGVKHSLNEHSNKDKEEPRVQVPINEEDIKRASEYVYSYDKSVWGEKNDQGRDIIKLFKQLDDGYLLYIEEIRTGRHTLTLNAMRKYKNKIDNILTP